MRISSSIEGRWIRDWAKEKGLRIRKNPEGIISSGDFYHIPLRKKLGSVTQHTPGELSITLNGSNRKLRPYLARLEKVPGLIPQFGWDPREQPEDGTFINLSSDDWSDDLEAVLDPLKVTPLSPERLRTVKMALNKAHIARGYGG